MRASLQRKSIALLLLVSLLLPDLGFAFCGFYVAKADATLFNKSSQVILVRDGDKTTITMFNDYQGSVKDFAMVVPVPVVLRRDQIKTVAKELFTAFDDYSGPRLVDYYDQDPCRLNINGAVADSTVMLFSTRAMGAMSSLKQKNEYHVKIEAQYLIDGYDVVILSAEESGGLERWLIANGYKIPEGAKEVLKPYIQGNLKFFVVKVNLEEYNASGSNDLKPLQLQFHSPKFMLPIRLGMANSTGDQDLIIYTLTRNGRVEPVNYRNAKLPTDKKVPEFISKKFGEFYKDAFAKAWKREGKASLMLEYAWDISGTQSTKCDPCPAPPLTITQLVTAGVDWISPDGWSGSGYLGPLFFTRIHARYNRSLYPQDFMFQETPNKEQYQARYVITHPAQSNYACDGAVTYLEDLIYRRREELNMLAYLTGWDIDKYDSYVTEFEMKYKNVTGNDFIPVNVPSDPGNGPGNPPASPWVWVFIFSLGLTAVTVLSLKRPKTVVK